jgi:hypothetical protein
MIGCVRADADEHTGLVPEITAAYADADEGRRHG